MKEIKAHIPPHKSWETGPLDKREEMDTRRGNSGPHLDEKGPMEGEFPTPDWISAKIYRFRIKNGRGLTNGNGMVNGMGFTNMSWEPTMSRPSRAHLWTDRGLTNGNDSDKSGLKTDRALINGLQHEPSSVADRPRSRISRKGRKHKTMMERIYLRSKIPIEEYGATGRMIQE